MGEVVLANSRAVVAGFLNLSSGVGLALGGVVFYRDSRERSLDRSPRRKYDREMPLSQSRSRASRKERYSKVMQGTIFCFVKLFVCLSIGRVYQIFVCSLGRCCGGKFRYPMCRDVQWVHVPISWLKSLRQHMWILLGATLVILIFFAVPESWALC